MKLSEVLNAALETGRRDVARRQKKKTKKTNKKRKQQTQTLLQLKYIFNFFRGIAQRLA